METKAKLRCEVGGVPKVPWFPEVDGSASICVYSIGENLWEKEKAAQADGLFRI
jgi:hypothetical protein